MSRKPPVVGRDREVDALAQLVDHVDDGGVALAIIGDAGIGKSTLLWLAVDHARADGFRVLETIGVETETSLPYAALHQLLRPVLTLMAQLPGGQQRALATALGIDAGPAPEPFLVSLAALNLLSHVAATTPVVVAVDDVQWLDPPTHDTLAFVARRVRNEPIVVLGTVRRGHSGPFMRAGFDELDVAPLTEGAARALLADQASDLNGIARERILREAIGNPLALVELPAAWRAFARRSTDLPHVALPLTARLERSFAGRLPDLPSATRDVLLLAAVDSVDELPEILAAAGVLAGGHIGVEAVDSATQAGLVTVDEMHVRFRHPLVRSAVIASEPIARRQAANGAVADVLTSEPFRRAWHRAQSLVTSDDDVADELEATHGTALQRGAVDAAIWALERSAQLTTDAARRGRRLLLAAEHAFGLGRADLVDRLLTDAARTPLGELDQARMVWLREIFNDGVPGDAGRVLELCDIAERSATAGDPDLALNLLLGAALRSWWADAGPVASRRVVQVIERSLPDRRLDPRYLAALGVAEPITSCATVLRLLDEVVLETVTDPDAMRLYGMAAKAVGEPVRAVDYFARAETRLREQGRLGLLGHVLTMQVLERLELGEWDRALAAVEEGQRVAQDTGQPIWDSGSLSLTAVVTALRGQRVRAHDLAARAEQAANRQGLNDFLACVQLARGLGWLASGHYPEAYDELRRLFDRDDEAFHSAERLHAIMFLAEAAVRAGRTDDAKGVVADLERLLETTPSTTLSIHLSYARAVLADDDAADLFYETALAQDLSRWPWPKARLELAYGSWLRRQRRVTESRAPLRAAATTLDLVGAGTWAEQARAELRAAGERAAAPAENLADLLSAQELQIARLAAEGLSNREIGERLYLSPRTIGSHLYRIFPKLNITSRSQLADRGRVSRSV